jgi:hypothetical protein
LKIIRKTILLKPRKNDSKGGGCTNTAMDKDTLADKDRYLLVVRKDMERFFKLELGNISHTAFSHLFPAVFKTTYDR